MKILEYNDVDPLQVLYLSLASGFPLTPEDVARIRRMDPRPFPCFTINAVEGKEVIGQMGILRLPMISIEGREDTGGIWAIAIHPKHVESKVAHLLLDEVHSRMREAGMRFSMLIANRSHMAYRLCQQQGYSDMRVWATALARWGTAHQPTRLSAKHAIPAGNELIEGLFAKFAPEYLGFVQRHIPFTNLRNKVLLENIWIVLENEEPVGYVVAVKNNAILQISIQLLRGGIDVTEAVSAVVSEARTPYVQVSTSRPSDIDRLKGAGYWIIHPNWNSLMMKPLTPEATLEEARRVFGIGSDRFLISELDI